MSAIGQEAPWMRQMGSVIAADVWLKAIGTTLFISTFFVAYFYVLRHPAYPAMVMPVIWLDRVISFQPMALPLYLSLWIYLSLLPAFIATRAELYRYSLSIALMCIAGLSIFYFWPTAAPAPDIDWSRYPDMGFLKNIDASGNACPSLHVATAFFTGIWFHHVLRRFKGPWWLLAINWAWCVGIVYSTVAIRQHVAVDAAAGLLLGGLAAWPSLRLRPAWRA